MGRGDALASGAKKATFGMGGDHRDAPIELKNVAPEEQITSHRGQFPPVHQAPPGGDLQGQAHGRPGIGKALSPGIKLTNHHPRFSQIEI